MSTVVDLLSGPFGGIVAGLVVLAVELLYGWIKTKHSQPTPTPTPTPTQSSTTTGGQSSQTQNNTYDSSTTDDHSNTAAGTFTAQSGGINNTNSPDSKNVTVTAGKNSTTVIHVGDVKGAIEKTAQKRGNESDDVFKDPKFWLFAGASVLAAAAFLTWPQWFQLVANIAAGLAGASWVICLLFLRTSTPTSRKLTWSWHVIALTGFLAAVLCSLWLQTRGSAGGVPIGALLAQAGDERLIPTLKTASDAVSAVSPYGTGLLFVLVIMKSIGVFLIFTMVWDLARGSLGISMASLGTRAPSGFAAVITQKHFPKGGVRLQWLRLLPLGLALLMVGGAANAYVDSLIDGSFYVRLASVARTIGDWIGA